MRFAIKKKVQEVQASEEVTAAVDWNYYNDVKFKEVNNLYLPLQGQGDTKAQQIVTCMNKLVYRWYNDGDVYDNTSGWILESGDVSTYANWLYKNLKGRVQDALLEVKDCEDESQYEDILQKVNDIVMDLGYLEDYEDTTTSGDIYNCSGPFRVDELEEEDWDDWEEEEDYDDDWDY